MATWFSPETLGHCLFEATAEILWATTFVSAAHWIFYIYSIFWDHSL